MNIECVKELVHYAVDKASPYALAQHEQTDTYEKIAGYRLTQLAITPQGLGQMWLWINAYVGDCSGKPVPASAATKCKTVKAVYDAIAAASKPKSK